MGGRGKTHGSKKAKSRSSKAGLQFPVGRIARLLETGKYAERVSAGAPVYLAAVLEYLAAEVLELAGDKARRYNKNMRMLSNRPEGVEWLGITATDINETRIRRRHIKRAVRRDEELRKLSKLLKSSIHKKKKKRPRPCSDSDSSDERRRERVRVGVGVGVGGCSNEYKFPPPATVITWTWNTGKEEDVRNWLELPPEVTLRILMKLETLDIVLTVSQVCSSWRRLSKDPVLYRSVFIGGYDNIFRGKWGWKIERIAIEAVDRSRGKLLQFSAGNMCRFFIEHLSYIADSSHSLKSLRLGLCKNIHFVDILEVVKRIPSLEELYIHDSFFPQYTFRDIGSCCPKLKYLQFGVLRNADAEALEIAKSLPYLRRLCLLANGVTNNGLQAILHGCPHLEYVYLKGFSNLEGELLLKKCCDRIKSITVLNRSDQFGVECEFHLKATSDGWLSDTAEEVSDYGCLSVYKSSFKDFFEPFYK